MESEEMIRAYMLEVGDIFRIQYVRFQVRSIDKGKIYYWQPEVRNQVYTIGQFSQQRLILITNKTKQNEH